MRRKHGYSVQMRVRIVVWSFAISVALTTLVAAVASLPSCSAIGVLLLPGALLAAVAFPQGVNSNGGNIYLLVAGVLDAMLLTLPVMWFWALVKRRRKQR